LSKDSGAPHDDAGLQELLASDPAQGWREFVERFTPVLLAIIGQAGLRSRDEVMDVYVLTCEKLAENACARLRRHDPAKGSLRAWLGTAVRNVLVDWMRSRKGRRRLFKSIEALPPLDRHVFELYYWRQHTAVEIAEMVRDSESRPLGLPAVLDALERVEQALTERQRGELLAFLARAQTPVSIEAEDGQPSLDLADVSTDPERALRMEQAQAALSGALAQLPAEDALIVSLRYRDGLSHAQVQRGLHLPQLSRQRVQAILARLRALIEERGIAPGEFDLGQAPLRPEGGE
jgi:DNA-directed RNA polymerase specialized sigma24 family protein